ncbi:uncharacterized protein si:dkey-1h24.6 [Alosa alosa]|uniref:uncharacterized protein si:dkey-1h24.6 n=1 Tax=Alosa alosa TaxID=278164 RepID=UPI0020152ADB|nr:uncharacterized protein si:dkey-1h24.6 [Alosa alosa]
MDRGMAAMMLWVFAVHLCLNVICEAQPEMFSGCKVCGNVSMPCPGVPGDEKSHKLFRNGQLLHSVNYGSNQSKKVLSSRELSQLINQSDNNSYFLISQLNVNSSGIYGCEVCVHYPPPITCKRNSEAVVFIEYNCPSVKPTMGVTSPPNPMPDHRHIPLLVALGLVTLYGLLLTPVTFKFWRASRKSQFQDHDYINMRLFGRGKYNGVQHPVHPGKH